MRKLCSLAIVTLGAFCLFSFWRSCLPPNIAWAEETYRYVQMWPPLSHHWYFDNSTSVAVSPEGFIYIVDAGHYQIQKLSADGTLITTWGENGEGEGRFLDPYGVAVDLDGRVYVTDSDAAQVQIFDADGRFIAAWKNASSGEPMFINPKGVAIGSDGRVYVADAGDDKIGSSRVVQLDADGNCLARWDGSGGERRFGQAFDVAVSPKNGHVYVVDDDKLRVKAFTKDGEFVFSHGREDFLDTPDSIAIDKDGFVYVSDSGTRTIHKFDAHGNFLKAWGADEAQGLEAPGGIDIVNGVVHLLDGNRLFKFSTEGELITRFGSGDGSEFLKNPDGVAIGPDGMVYVADTGNSKIKKFSPDGTFIKEWNGDPSAGSNTMSPIRIAVDEDRYVYVADKSNDCIQKFDADGEFIRSWGKDRLSFPWDVAIHGDNVYIVDKGHDQIQKYDKDGQWLLTFRPPEDDPLSNAEGVAVYGDIVYVADQSNDCIKIFNTSGHYSGRMQQGTGTELLDMPNSISVDPEGYLYVTNMNKHQIVKMNPSGDLIAQWGEAGSFLGQFNQPGATALGPDGRVYVADNTNHRIQVFKKIEDPGARFNAVIVAGGGPYPGNKLWDAIRSNANCAYSVLYERGFTKDDIHYLSEDGNVDLNQNGDKDDVDDVPTKKSLENVIAGASESSTSLILYLVGHGGHEGFQLNQKETVSAEQLKQWIDEYQGDAPKKVVVVYDACQSGGFIPALCPPSSQRRLILTSASETENAHFLSQGAFSFSRFFWQHVMLGDAVGRAFEQAKAALMSETGETKLQSPMKAQADINPNNLWIGSRVNHGETTSPVEDVRIESLDKVFQVIVDVRDDATISRAWATIIPRSEDMIINDQAVLGYPEKELIRVGNNQYKGLFTNIDVTGDYVVAVDVTDQTGNRRFVKVSDTALHSASSSKVLMVLSDPLPESLRFSALMGCRALEIQGYDHKDIFLVGPEDMLQDGNKKATKANCQEVVETLLAMEIKDVLIYIAGVGDGNSFAINPDEHLSAGTIKGWLEAFQNHVSGKLVFVYDGDYSGNFLPRLAGDRRVLIASAGGNQQSLKINAGNLCFSRFFWDGILNGLDLRSAFMRSKEAVSLISDVVPLMDDNGNGVGNELDDGNASSGYAIGIGTRMSDNAPLLTLASSDIIDLEGKTSVNLPASDINSLRDVEGAWVMIARPKKYPGVEADAPLTTRLVQDEDGRYAADCAGFDHFGFYKAIFYAVDRQDIVSERKSITIFQSKGADVFEPDDSPASSHQIFINHENPQFHSLHQPNDVDFLKFYAFSGKNYSIRVHGVGTITNIFLEAISDDIGAQMMHNFMPDKDHCESAQWQCEKDGIHYLKISRNDHLQSVSTVGYGVEITEPIGPLTGFIKGKVKDKASGQPVADAQIQTVNTQSGCMSQKDGGYILIHESGQFEVLAMAAGYESAKCLITVSQGGTTVADFFLEPGKTDKNGASDSVTDSKAADSLELPAGKSAGGVGCFINSISHSFNASWVCRQKSISNKSPWRSFRAFIKKGGRPRNLGNSSGNTSCSPTENQGSADSSSS